MKPFFRVHLTVQADFKIPLNPSLLPGFWHLMSHWFYFFRNTVLGCFLCLYLILCILCSTLGTCLHKLVVICNYNIFYLYYRHWNPSFREGPLLPFTTVTSRCRDSTMLWLLAICYSSDRDLSHMLITKKQNTHIWLKQVRYRQWQYKVVMAWQPWSFSMPLKTLD